MNLQQYLQIWSSASAEVLQQALGAEYIVQLDPEDDNGPAKAEADAGVYLGFAVAEPLGVQQGFWISPSDAIYLGQSFMGEIPDPLSELTLEHRDATAELFRQIAGTAALALKAQVGRECPVSFSGSAEPTWTAAVRARFRWIAQGRPPIAVHIQLDSTLQASEPAPSAVAGSASPQPSPTASSAEPSSPAPEVREQRNLELLLDMELEVAIRFGKRDMLLRDILDLNPGGVVDFEQHIQDPVELLLGGRVIGRGDVVVVDGNYGLRVTEITGARARLNSLVK